jgi:hypothetical protein
VFDTSALQTVSVRRVSLLHWWAAAALFHALCNGQHAQVTVFASSTLNRSIQLHDEHLVHTFEQPDLPLSLAY